MVKVAGRGCFVLGESRNPKFCQYDYGNFLSQLSCFLRLLKTAKITYILLDFGIRIPFIMCMFHSSRSEDINRGLTMDNRFIECTVYLWCTQRWQCFMRPLCIGMNQVQFEDVCISFGHGTTPHTSTNMYRAFNIRLARFSWNSNLLAQHYLLLCSISA